MPITEADRAKAIQVWAWDDAPDEFRALFPYTGGNYVAYVPQITYDSHPNIRGLFSVICDIHRYEVTGGVVLVGANY